MMWFKHDTDANQDAKLQNVLLDYGLEGYGLYWYCIELIAGKINKENFTFELEHDARIIARNVGSTPQKVEEMMKYFVSQGLFENNENTITCFKLLKRMDQSMTSNPQFRAMINSAKINLLKHDYVMISSCSNHDAVITQSTDHHELEVEVEVEVEKKRERECDSHESLTLVFSDSEKQELKKWAFSAFGSKFNFELELQNFIDYALANGKTYKNKISAAKLNIRRQANWAGIPEQTHASAPTEKFKIQSEINSLKILLAQQRKSKTTPPAATESTLRKISELEKRIESA